MRFPIDLKRTREHYSEQLLIARLQEERHEHLARIRHLREAHASAQSRVVEVELENYRLRDALAYARWTRS